MAATIMTYLSLIPVTLFAVLAAINLGIILARAAHRDAWAYRMQSWLNRVSWLFRLGGGSRQRG